MTTLEEIKRENTVADSSSLRTAMPSRAKYYFNTEGKAEPGCMNMRAARYNEVYPEEAKPSAYYGMKNLYIEDEDLKKDIQSGNPDILPTGATLKMLQNKHKAPAKPFEGEEAVAYKVNAKGKMLFAVYAVLVLSLILVIVLNALAIERQKSENAALGEEIAFASNNLFSMNEEAEQLNQSSYILKQAKLYGMVEKEAISIKLNIPQASENTVYEPKTNWFDWLCDLIS